MTKETHETPATPPQAPAAQPASPLSIASLVMGIVSLTGPGLLLGIPAIITGAMALKRKEGGHGLSVAGLVTGIISTVLSVLFIIFMIFIMIFAISNPSETDKYRMRDGSTYNLERPRI